MTTDLERMVVSLEANIKGYERTMAKAMGVTNTTARNIQSRFDKINPGFEGIRKGILNLGVALSGAGLISGFKQLVGGLGQVRDLADRAQVSTDFIQAIGFAASQAGGSMEDAARAATKFGKELGEAGSQENYLSRLFKENGISLRDRNGQLRDATVLFGEYARLVANAKNPQEGMNMLSQVFGEKVGPKMNTTMMQIAQVGLPAFIAGMKEAGHVLEESVINAGDKIDDQWNALTDRWTKKFKSFIVDSVREWETLISAMSGEAVAPAVSAEGRPVVTIQGNSRPTKQPPPAGGRGSKTLDDFKRLEAQMRTNLLLEETELANIDKTAAAREQLKVQIQLQTAAVEANREAGKKNTAVTAEQQAVIDSLSKAYGELKAKQEAANMPLPTFARDAAKLNENLQNVAVQGLQGFEDALLDIAMGAETAENAFKKMAAAILQDLARMIIRMQITGPLAAALGGMGGGMPGIPGMGAAHPLGAGAQGPMPMGDMPGIEAAGAPRIPKTIGGGGSSGGNVNISTSIDARGANMTEAQFKAALDQRDARIRADVVPLLKQAKSRRVA